MIYHVTSFKKLQAYMQNGNIRRPVRAWTSIEAAQRVSAQTGRRIILRLKKDETFRPLEGHKCKAVVSESIYKLRDM